MVGVLGSWSSGPGVSPGQGHFTLTVPLYTQVYFTLCYILLLMGYLRIIRIFRMSVLWNTFVHMHVQIKWMDTVQFCLSFDLVSFCSFLNVLNERSKEQWVTPTPCFVSNSSTWTPLLKGVQFCSMVCVIIEKDKPTLLGQGVGGGVFPANSI